MPEPQPDEDALYDEFLDACLQGVAPAPAAFLEGRDDVSAGLRERLEAAYALGGGTTHGGTLPFERLGAYRIQRRLGVGGMGSVYQAVHESLDRSVALKVIRADLRGSRTMMQRFRREARAVARLRHPNIVNVYEFGSDGDYEFIAMELVAGQSLDVVLREDPPGLDRLLDWGAQLAGALAYAHDEGVVHRDVKPQNVMITPAGRPVLLDFGLARMTDTSLTSLTRAFAGTPQYAAPEQIVEEGSAVDGRADLYALGVTLYEGLTGRLPFEGGRIDELLLRIVRDDPTPPRKVVPTIPVDVETVVLKLLEKDPDRRYATGWTLSEDLRRVRSLRPIQARRPGLFVRGRKWIRRHPVGATVLSGAMLAAVLAVVVIVNRVLEAHREARAKVEEARELVAELRAARLAMRPREQELRRREAALGTRWLDAKESEAYEALLDEVQAHRREREAGFYRVQDLLADAARLHPQVPGRRETLAALFVERVEGARTAGDTQLEAYYRRELTRVDPDGSSRAALQAKATLEVVTTPPGATLHLLRYRILRELVPGGDRRWVPVPEEGADASADPALEPGREVLRVVHGAGGLAQGDLLLEVHGQSPGAVVFAAADGERIKRGDRVVRVDDHPVRSLYDVDPRRLAEARALTYVHDDQEYDVLAADRDVGFVDARGLAQQGGIGARVFSGGRVREVTLPAGLIVRPTAAPRYLTQETRAGTTPLAGPLSLPPGPHVVVLRLDGYEDVVLPVALEPGEALRRTVDMLPSGTTPEGYVFVPGDAGVGTGEVRPEGDHAFWIQEREVTLREYLPFLNDRKRWHACGAVAGYIPIEGGYVPDFAQWQENLQTVVRDSSGAYRLRDASQAERPVRMITWTQARAFARWKGMRDGLVYGLPTLGEWMRAGGGDGRRFPFGDAFRPAWACSPVSRKRPVGAWELECAFRYPIDESPLGVYAMAGGVSEWLDQPWGEAGDGLQQFTGGSAAEVRPDAFQLGSGEGGPRNVAYDRIGFRLVIRSLGGGR